MVDVALDQAPWRSRLVVFNPLRLSAEIPCGFGWGLPNAEVRSASTCLFGHVVGGILHERPREAAAHHFRFDVQRADKASGHRSAVTIELQGLAANRLPFGD